MKIEIKVNYSDFTFEIVEDGETVINPLTKAQQQAVIEQLFFGAVEELNRKINAIPPKQKTIHQSLLETLLTPPRL